MSVPSHFSALARRSSDPPISWLMRLALERRDLISLAAGFTDSDTLPREETAALAAEILSRPRQARAALQYGTTQGLPALRQELVRRWRRQDRIGAGEAAVTADEVIVTNGSQQLLYLLAEVLCDPGDVVLVEDPTYFVFLGIVEARGIRSFGFEGVEGLTAKLQKLKTKGLLPRLKFVYAVTYFRNPTGHTWSLEEKREALAVVRHYERAAGHRLYVLEDAAYRDLRWEGQDVPSFKSLDPRNERVVYAQTLTKPFATGLRVGYGLLPRWLLRATVRSKGNHDFGTSNFLQVLLERAMVSGAYDRHLPRIASGYRRKRDEMLAALGKHLPLSARYTRPEGGMYVWVQLGAEREGKATETGMHSPLFRRALDRGVLYVPGEMCFCKDPTRRIPRDCLRLSFGAPDCPQIREGIRRLAQAVGR